MIPMRHLEQITQRLREIARRNIGHCDRCHADDTFVRSCVVCGNKVCSDCIDWMLMAQLDTSLITCLDCSSRGLTPHDMSPLGEEPL